MRTERRLGEKSLAVDPRPGHRVHTPASATAVGADLAQADALPTATTTQGHARD